MYSSRFTVRLTQPLFLATCFSIFIEVKKNMWVNLKCKGKKDGVFGKKEIVY